MKYLVDTTWIIEYLRGSQEIVQRLDSLRHEGLAVGIISVAELYEGVYRSNNPSADERRLQDFLSAETVLGIDEDACRVFGRERARLRQTGTAVGDMDLLIAAIALRDDLTLLTLDSDFLRVENLNTQFH